MSSKDDETNAAAMALALIGLAALAILAFVAAVVGFFALVGTILALCAWNDDIELGSHTLTQEEARAFIGRGLICMVLAPAFWLFCCVLFQLNIEQQYWGYIVLGGYAFGSAGVEILNGLEEQNNPPPQVLPPVANQRAQGFQQYTPPPEANPAPQRPFTFASWDDEDAA